MAGPAEPEENIYFSLRILGRFLARFGAGLAGHVSHHNEHDATKPEITKTYGRFLVRFFCIKMNFSIFLCSVAETGPRKGRALNTLQGKKNSSRLYDSVGFRSGGLGAVFWRNPLMSNVMGGNWAPPGRLPFYVNTITSRGQKPKKSALFHVAAASS